MPRRAETPPVNRRSHSEHQQASLGGLGRGGLETDHGGPRPASPFAAMAPRRLRFSSVPLVELRPGEVVEETILPASMELPRRHVTFYSDSDSESSLSIGGLCSMSDTMECYKDGGSPSAQASVRIKHLTRNSDGSSRFPKLDECAHFHYDNVELGPINVSLCEERGEPIKVPANNETGTSSGSASDLWFRILVSSNGKSWDVRRSIDNFHMLDRQLHRCVYDRKFSLLKEISSSSFGVSESEDDTTSENEDAVRTMLTEYLERFSQLAGSLINCGPVLNWLELDNRGNRLIVTDEAAINTPAIAAAYVTKRYASQANDEISLEVGDIISVIDMPPPDESTWWRAKKGFQVGFFPCECVEIIGDKVPQTIKIPKISAKPVLRKHGKLIAFFRSFLLSRPSRRKLKQSGILKERVFGCDLGEHLMNSGRDIPLVLKCCTEFIEEHGIVDGIYRLSGVTSNIQKLRLAFDEDKVPNLLDEAILQDIHCVASLLKMYFRELPNPLLTFHLYDKFVNAVQADEDIRLLKLRDVVQQLPPPHYRSLEYLMRHLSKVAAYGSQTGMTPKNVAIVWAPNLLRDVENGGVGALHVVGVQAVLTEYLIRYTDIIFSEKMPVFPSPVPGEETPKKTRPKSLAISTPTKLLSLEEARSRALTSNLPTEQQKFIEVGGGADNLPTKYHTVIELPAGRRLAGKGKKSPSGWKSFFSRGWHTTSGRNKSRGTPRSSGRIQSPKALSPMFAEHSPLYNQEKAVTEADVAHTNPKKLRTVKSAESLLLTVGVGLTCQKLDIKDSFSPKDESTLSSQPASIEYTPLQEASPVSPSKSPGYQKHIRSTSHDSYFEHVVEFSGNEETENEDDESVALEMKTLPEGECSIDSKLNEEELLSVTELIPQQDRDNYTSENIEDSSSSTQKVAQKQKLVTFDSEASSPKLQKLSLKRLYQTLSSPPMVRRRDVHVARRSESLSCDDGRSQSRGDRLKQTRVHQSQDGVAKALVPDRPVLVQEHKSGVLHQLATVGKNNICEEVPLGVQSLEREATHIQEISLSRDTGSVPEETIFAEVHAASDNLEDLTCLSSSQQTSIDDILNTDETLQTSVAEHRDTLMSLSMEATLSDTISLSQLLSFDSKDGVMFSPSFDREGTESQDPFSAMPFTSSLATPDSPTMDNVSDMPSSAGSEMSCSPGEPENGNKQLTTSFSSNKFVFEESNDSEQMEKRKGRKHSNLSSPISTEAVGVCGNVSNILSPLKFDCYTESKNGNLLLNADEMLAKKTSTLHIASVLSMDNSNEQGKADVSAVLIGKTNLHNDSKDLFGEETVKLENVFVDENLILSPPDNFIDDHLIKSKKDAVNKNHIRSKSRVATARGLERSKTEVHEICPKFVSGIAVSGSFGHEFSATNQDLADSVWSIKKRSCSDRLSPISPVEESRRRFESEIGRLIVRDRQMRLEMEQMQAERQKCKQKIEVTTNSLPDRTVLVAKTEKKFADIDVRKSPGKLSDTPDKKKILESEDIFKTTKDNLELKKLSEPSSTHVYPRYLRMDKKPSVKELLSKFEVQQKQDTDFTSSKRSLEILDSMPKTKVNMFTNVQVINHQLPCKDSSLDFCEVKTCMDTIPSHHLKEHIFQTECVVRFPHPKGILAKDSSSLSRPEDSSSTFLDSYRSAKREGRHRMKLNNSRDAFLTSDKAAMNLMTSSDSTLPSATASSEVDYSKNSTENSCDSLDRMTKRRERIDRYKEERRAELKVQLQPQSLCDMKNKQPSPLRANDTTTTSLPPSSRQNETKTSVKLKTEFLKFEFHDKDSGFFRSEVPNQRREFNSAEGVCFPQNSRLTCDDSEVMRTSATRSERRQRHSPVKQRPRSVPPPVCRLSVIPSSQPAAMHVLLPMKDRGTASLNSKTGFENVPKRLTSPFHNGSPKREESETSQKCSPPKRIRERAAMFERSLSFSGYSDRKAFSSPSQT